MRDLAEWSEVEASGNAASVRMNDLRTARPRRWPRAFAATAVTQRAGTWNARLANSHGEEMLFAILSG
jgi:hypothetical protein